MFLHMVKNRVQPKVANIGTIYYLKIGDDLEEILFGCAVCANSPTVNKIIKEPFVVTLNSKIKNNKIFHLPPVFAKRLKTEDDLKIMYIFWRFVLNFDEVSRNL